MCVWCTLYTNTLVRHIERRVGQNLQASTSFMLSQMEYGFVCVEIPRRGRGPLCIDWVHPYGKH